MVELLHQILDEKESDEDKGLSSCQEAILTAGLAAVPTVVYRVDTNNAAAWNTDHT